MTPEQAYDWLAPKLSTEERKILDVIYKSAERYQWLRDRLAIEDIERIEHEFFGTPDEQESVKADIAIDKAMTALSQGNAGKDWYLSGTGQNRTN